MRLNTTAKIVLPVIWVTTLALLIYTITTCIKLLVADAIANNTPLITPKNFGNVNYTMAQIDMDLQLLVTQKAIADLKKQVIKMTAEKCLTDNIYYESAFEPEEGRLAVAQVTMNRAHNKKDNVCNVVYFKKVNPSTGKKEAAFSWTLGSKWRAKGMNHRAYQVCAQMARAVLTKGLRSDIIGPNVIMYHANYIAPRWKDDHLMVAQIGAHIFYK